jgi:hypothetical protein
MQRKVSFSNQTEQIFIDRSRELVQMSAYERFKFLSKHDDVTKDEKVNVLDTFIGIMEKVEDFETCQSLFDLKKALLGRPTKE